MSIKSVFLAHGNTTEHCLFTRLLNITVKHVHPYKTYPKDNGKIWKKSAMLTHTVYWQIQNLPTDNSSTGILHSTVHGHNWYMSNNFNLLISCLSNTWLANSKQYKWKSAWSYAKQSIVNHATHLTITQGLVNQDGKWNQSARTTKVPCHLEAGRTVGYFQGSSPDGKPLLDHIMHRNGVIVVLLRSSLLNSRVPWKVILVVDRGNLLIYYNWIFTAWLP